MKKRIVGIIICMLVLFSTFSILVPSESIDGNTIYVDDNSGADYTIIQDAIDAASDGDTIFIYNGVYEPSTNIHVYKELTIIGESKEGVIIEHEIGSEELSIRAKNVKVSTITFRNFRITNQGIYDNTIITDNIFIIDNEEKHWNPEVIFIAGSNNEISNNIMTFTGTYDGSRNPSSGIFMQCYESKITNNIITGVGGKTTALLILDRSYWVDELVKGKNIIEGNTFEKNGCGIRLIPTLRIGYNSRIIHNNFIDNYDNAKFIVSLPSVVDIIRNNIKKLIYLADTLKTSDTMSNIINLRYWDENYWDNYGGSGPMIITGSLQSAGLVNNFFHYVFPWLNLDFHPASEPFNIE
jgi:hypothetical protein